MIERIITQFARPELAWVLFLVAGAIVGGIVAIVVTIANLYANYRRQGLAATAIADMVERGFTADEIAEVLRVGGLEAHDCSASPPKQQAQIPPGYADARAP